MRLITFDEVLDRTAPLVEEILLRDHGVRLTADAVYGKLARLFRHVRDVGDLLEGPVMVERVAGYHLKRGAFAASLVTARQILPTKDGQLRVRGGWIYQRDRERARNGMRRYRARREADSGVTVPPVGGSETLPTRVVEPLESPTPRKDAALSPSLRVTRPLLTSTSDLDLDPPTNSLEISEADAGPASPPSQLGEEEKAGRGGESAAEDHRHPVGGLRAGAVATIANAPAPTLPPALKEAWDRILEVAPPYVAEFLVAEARPSRLEGGFLVIQVADAFRRDWYLDFLDEREGVRFELVEGMITPREEERRRERAREDEGQRLRDAVRDVKSFLAFDRWLRARWNEEATRTNEERRQRPMAQWTERHIRLLEQALRSFVPRFGIEKFLSGYEGFLRDSAFRLKGWSPGAFLSFRDGRFTTLEARVGRISEVSAG